jgi:tyrosyl-tRNA synthetase
MSKSYKNYVGLTDEPNDMYGKLMSIADEMVPRYFRLCSTLSIDEVDAIDEAFKDGTADPYKLKRQLARNIVDLYHGEGQGALAEAAFDAQFKQNEVPEDIPEFPLSTVQTNEDGKVYLGRLLVDVNIFKSAGEARRAIDSGSVKIDGTAVPAKGYNVDPSLFKAGTTLQSGKRRWARLV